MSRKPTSQIIIDKVKRFIADGMTYKAVGKAIGLSDMAVKGICYRYRIAKPESKRQPMQETKEFCFLSDKQLDKNVRALVASYGIDNKPVVRQATAGELAEFESVKPYKKRSEASHYVTERYCKEAQGYGNKAFTGKGVVRPKSTIKILKNRRKIYEGNMSKVLAI